MSGISLDCLFETLEMPNLRLENRFYMAPMGTGYTGETLINYLTARARGGVGLITTEESCVYPGGRAGITNELLNESDKDIDNLSRIARAVKDAGSKIVIQLNHAGRYSLGRNVGGQSVAPSAIMSGYTGETPRALTTDEADGLVTAFAKAALRAREAGFDGVEFMGSSGYLISEFLSPLTNKREDKYGGDVLGRAAFIVSILKETRKLVGDDFNICVKFDADDGMAGGVTLEESKIFAPVLVEAGADRLHIWAGWHESPRPMLPMFVERGAFAYLSREIKKRVNVPVSTVGRINDPETAAAILSAGDADLIGLGRALLADPDFVNKTREGRLREIRRCTACCHCFDRILLATRKAEPASICCALNPELGREGENLIKKTEKKRHIAVAGGGPAGLEAARVASIRGHRVTLYEESGKIGGMVNLAFVPPHKEELKTITDYYAEVLKLQNVEIKLNTRLDADELGKLKPDAVVIATGGEMKYPDIPGINNNNVISAFDVLDGKTITGDNVAVIGGGMAGLETAEYLAEEGKKVTVIEMDKIARDMGPSSRNGFIARLRRKVRILTSTRVIKISEGSVLVIGRDGEESGIFCDSIVIASGLQGRRGLVDALLSSGIEYHLAGSCRETGQIDEAVSDGFEVGRVI